jgi:thiamine kinase-like enzyme
MTPRTDNILNAAIDNWRHWDTGTQSRISVPPKVEKQLIGGLTNEAFLVTSGDLRAVVRVNSANTDALGISREREHRLLTVLQPSGCVPRLLFSDSEVQITQLIEGRHLTRGDLKDKVMQDHLENCIERIQSYSVDYMTKRNYKNYINLYSDQVPNFDGLSEIESAASLIDMGEWEPVISHHDLILENIIWSNQGMFFIDWEYAHLGHPLIDHVKLFGRNYCYIMADMQTINALYTLHSGITKLWYALQEILQNTNRVTQG